MSADNIRIDRPEPATSDAAEARRERQDEQDPSGHNMQVTPRQQQQVAESSDQPPTVTAQMDEDELKDLKGESELPS